MQTHIAFWTCAPLYCIPIWVHPEAPGGSGADDLMEAQTAKARPVPRRDEQFHSASVWPCPVGGITHELEAVLFPGGPTHCLPALLPPKFY